MKTIASYMLKLIRKFPFRHHRMILSGCYSISTAKPGIILASLRSNSSHPNKPSKIATTPKPNQPSVSEIERALGAGIYRDHDPASSSDTADNKGVFDAVLTNSIGKTEGKTERALRETGEWISEKSERAARSSGKKILELMYLWIAPVWLLLLLVATGAVKLPFSFSALDDFLM